MTARNKSLVARFIEDILSHGDTRLIEEIVSPGHVLHGADGDLYGQEGMRIAVAEFRAAFPDVRVTLEDINQRGDWITGRFVFQGTHLGPYRGVARSGAPVVVSGTVVDRIEHDRLAESWITIDGLELARQLGQRAGPAPACRTT